MLDAHEFADVEVVVELQPRDAASVAGLKQKFPEEEIFEAEAFTGQQTLTIVVTATKKAFGALMDFIATHRESYKGATVKIGAEEIALTGYTMDEVRGLLESDKVQKLLKEMKKK